MRAMCGELKDRKRSMDLMLILGLRERIDQFAMASSVCLHGHLLRREDGHAIGRALDCEVEDQRKKGRVKRTWKKQVEEKMCDFWLEQRRCTLSIKVECWS